MKDKPIKLNLLGLLDFITGIDDWVETGVSADPPSWQYKTKDDIHEALIILDDRWLNVTVDGDVMYDGELAEDEQLSPFWSEDDLFAPGT
jgi:hypothetical protein